VLRLKFGKGQVVRHQFLLKKATAGGRISVVVT
jgi:hypothetical protein